MRKATSKTTKSVKKVHPPSKPYEDVITPHYLNKHYASLALQDALAETDEPRLLCLVLQRIIKAHGGFSHVAKLTGIRREDLYRAVSLKTTPKIHVVYQILTALSIPFRFPYREVKPRVGKQGKPPKSRVSVSNKPHLLQQATLRHGTV